LPVLVMLALILVSGYATQRGNICALAAVIELVRHRRGHRFVGFFLCAAAALMIIAAAEVLGIPTAALRPSFNPNLLTVTGGAIFAVGVFINGKCSFGTIARLGAGEMARIGTIVGFTAGAALALPLRPQAGSTASPLVGTSAWAEFTVAIIAYAGLLLALRFWLRDARLSRSWSPTLSMSVIGLMNGTLIGTGNYWPYTSILLDMASGHAGGTGRRIAMAVVFVIGAILGAVVGGTFRPEIGSLRAWLRASVGGIGMGVGATLIPGGNDVMLLIGLPLLLPNLLLAYFVMNATLIALIVCVGGSEYSVKRGPVRRTLDWLSKPEESVP
jgi:uncharacterized membrane protein YedE/YeeE